MDWRVLGRRVAIALAVALSARPVAAHAGGLSGTYRSAPIPSWLFFLTGAGIIGASFLFTSLITDHATIRDVNGVGFRVPSVATLQRALGWLVAVAGVAGLLLVLAGGFLGSATGEANVAVLVVWAGWWAGYTMSVYLVGNTWPALDPWRTVADLLPRVGDREYPARFGRWPSVAGLFGLVFVEVVTPVAQAPRLLAGLVLAYTVVTLAGAAVFGAEPWFTNVDPITGVFRVYGRLAPVQFTGDGVRLRVPGAALTEPDAPESADGTAFVVALLWVTTFDGLVTTSAWAAVIRPLVSLGVPALLVYLLGMVVGFGLFWGVYRLVAGWARGTADSYVSASFVRGWFVYSLVPIAAGYHLAHFLGYFLSLSPVLLTVLQQPFTPLSTVPVAVLPGWFGALQLLFVVGGHLLAVWVAHSLAFEVFTGRLQPIRSQYPFILVMIGYTATSMWIVSQPFTAPPFV
jgi:hypothetical protein